MFIKPAQRALIDQSKHAFVDQSGANLGRRPRIVFLGMKRKGNARMKWSREPRRAWGERGKIKKLRTFDTVPPSLKSYLVKTNPNSFLPLIFIITTFPTVRRACLDIVLIAGLLSYLRCMDRRMDPPWNKQETFLLSLWEVEHIQ